MLDSKPRAKNGSQTWRVYLPNVCNCSNHNTKVHVYKRTACIAHLHFAIQAFLEIAATNHVSTKAPFVTAVLPRVSPHTCIWWTPMQIQTGNKSFCKPSIYSLVFITSIPRIRQLLRMRVSRFFNFIVFFSYVHKK